jgi:hypothetical protein
MSCGVIFWGYSVYTKKVFYIQQKTSTIMAGAKRKVSCRELLRKFNILPLAREFLHSSLCVMDMDNTCVEQQVSKRDLLFRN